MEKDDRSVHIHGPITSSPIHSGEFHGPVTYNYSESTTIGIADSITINKEYLKKMPPEYAQSLEQLIGGINEELKKEKVSPEKVDLLRESANKLAKELADLKQDTENVSFEKKNYIGSQLVKFGKAIATASPAIARKVIGMMTPLAPISVLVGEAFEKIVEDALEE